MAYRGNVLVTGAGGFVGCHLVTYLKRQGYWVRGVDLKYPDFSSHAADDFLLLDLRRQDDCFEATRNVEEVYALASDTGGSEFLSSRKAYSTYNNLLINLHTLEAARTRRIKRYLFTSSLATAFDPWTSISGVAPPTTERNFLLRQQTVALEQQLGERLCLHYSADYGIETRVVRLPNVFGPLSPWESGKERAPAALCRKIATAKLTGSSDIEIWGDGEQLRSFCYIDDCVSALYQAMLSSHPVSVVSGAASPLTINQLADIITRIAGIQVSKKYTPVPENPLRPPPDDATTPRVASTDPLASIEQGLVNTYAWIEDRVRAQLARTSTSIL